MSAEEWLAEIYRSDMPTNRLAAAALTLGTVDGRNELFGRSHAWYSIASTQAAAIEFLMDVTEIRRRRLAATALAKAGYQASQLAGRDAFEIGSIPAVAPDERAEPAQ
jgi:hypothetical protein